MHTHHHGDAAGDYRSRQCKRLAIFLIGVVVTILEWHGAMESHSLFLFSDGGHVGIESIIIALSMVVDAVTTEKPHTRRLFYAIDAYTKGLLLITLSVFIGISAVMRVWQLPSILTRPMLIYTLIGLAGNILQFLLHFSIHDEHAGHHGFTAHLAMDIGQSLVIIVDWALIETTGWFFWDLLFSGMIAATFAPIGLAIILRGRREYITHCFHPH